MTTLVYPRPSQYIYSSRKADLRGVIDDLMEVSTIPLPMMIGRRREWLSFNIYLVEVGIIKIFGFHDTNP